MAFRCETGLELSSTPALKRSNTAECSPSTSATRVSATTRTLRYPWSMRGDGKFIASSFTGKPAANSHAGGFGWLSTTGRGSIRIPQRNRPFRSRSTGLPQRRERDKTGHWPFRNRSTRAARRMRILCTNDDGIHAPGLKIVEEIARALSDDVWVVAPELDQSGVSHSLSLNDPLRLREVGPRHFAVRGTPTDCVIMGARHILGPTMPDLVLS